MAAKGGADGAPASPHLRHGSRSSGPRRGPRPDPATRDGLRGGCRPRAQSVSSITNGASSVAAAASRASRAAGGGGRRRSRRRARRRRPPLPAPRPLPPRRLGLHLQRGGGARRCRLVILLGASPLSATCSRSVPWLEGPCRAVAPPARRPAPPTAAAPSRASPAALPTATAAVASDGTRARRSRRGGARRCLVRDAAAEPAAQQREDTPVDVRRQVVLEPPHSSPSSRTGDVPSLLLDAARDGHEHPALGVAGVLAAHELPGDARTACCSSHHPQAREHVTASSAASRQDLAERAPTSATALRGDPDFSAGTGKAFFAAAASNLCKTFSRGD